MSNMLERVAHPSDSEESYAYSGRQKGLSELVAC